MLDFRYRAVSATSSPDSSGLREKRNEDGFTLLDNLITLGIMLFTMMALIGLLGTVITANNTNKKRTIGITLAENKIAEVRRKGYDASLGADTTVANCPACTEGYNGGIPNYPNFKRVTLTKVNNPAAGMQSITVTVYWDLDKKQISKSTQLAQ
jgi:type II secretory pathway pseudopilin PulG